MTTISPTAPTIDGSRLDRLAWQDLPLDETPHDHDDRPAPARAAVAVWLTRLHSTPDRPLCPQRAVVGLWVDEQLADQHVAVLLDEIRSKRLPAHLVCWATTTTVARP